MKQFIQAIVIIGIMILSNHEASAQADLIGHSGTLTSQYVGWNSSTTFPLNIKHEGANSINFFTKNNQRATIDTNGNVGIGTMLPQRRLHVIDNAMLITDTFWVNAATFSLLDSTTTAGYFVAANPDALYSIGLVGRSTKGLNSNTGVAGVSWIFANAGDTLRNFGVRGNAKGSRVANTGVSGIAAFEIEDSCAVINSGVHGHAQGSGYENRGGYYITEGYKGVNSSVWARSTIGPPPSPWGA